MEDLAIPHAPDAGQRLVTISAGVATASGAEIGDGERLIRAADKALYQAKGSGRNRVIQASEDSP